MKFHEFVLTVALSVVLSWLGVLSFISHATTQVCVRADDATNHCIDIRTEPRAK